MIISPWKKIFFNKIKSNLDCWGEGFSDLDLVGALNCSGSVAIVGPGQGVLKHLEFIEKHDSIITMNLSSALGACFNVDYQLIERVDFSAFGLAQVEVIDRKNMVVLKNLWDSQSKENIFDFGAGGCIGFIDAPLKFSQFMTEEMILRYLNHRQVALSNWKSSLFCAVNSVIDSADKINVFGCFGGPKYFWEVDASMFDSFEFLHLVKSKPYHQTEIGRHPVPKMFQSFIIDKPSVEIFL